MYITTYQTKNPQIGYNLTDGGDGTTGYIFTAGHRAKLSSAVQRRILSGNYMPPNVGNFKLTFTEEIDICQKYVSGKYVAKQLADEYCVSVKTIFSTMKRHNIKLPENIYPISEMGLKNKKKKISENKSKITIPQVIDAYNKYLNKEWTVKDIAAIYGYAHTNSVYDLFVKMRKKNIIT